MSNVVTCHVCSTRFSLDHTTALFTPHHLCSPILAAYLLLEGEAAQDSEVGKSLTDNIVALPLIPALGSLALGHSPSIQQQY